MQTLTELIKEILADLDSLKESAMILESASHDPNRHWKLKEYEYHHHKIVERARVMQGKLLRLMIMADATLEEQIAEEVHEAHKGRDLF